MKKNPAQNTKRACKALPIVVFLLLFFNAVYLGSAQAVSGILDVGFGSQGVVLTDFSGSGNFEQALAVAIQADGKILVAGDSDAFSSGDLDFILARYNTDGTLDTTFNPSGPNPGIATVDASGGGNQDQIQAVAIQSDGNIVAAGFAFVNSSFDFAVARFTTEGILDTTFNPSGSTPGLVTTDFSGSGSLDEAFAVAIQSDQKIVVAGFSEAFGDPDFAVARYTTGGILDTTFNPSGSTPGLVTTDFSGSGSFEQALAVAIQPSDGKIVVAGESNAGTNGTSNFALARYTTSGGLDAMFDPSGSFGPAPGLVTTDFGSDFDDQAHAVSIQSDGKIVAAGSAEINLNDDDFALARYTTDGTLDATFNPSGSIPGLETEDVSGAGTADKAQALAIQSDGKIVATGFAFITGDDFALARYNAEGGLDKTTFNPFGPTPGLVLTDILNANDSDSAFAVAIQSDSKIVAVGSSNGGGASNDFTLARYLGDAADLSITKTASAASAAVGDTVTYTVTVKNNGPQAAGGVVVTDVLTGSVSFGSISVTQGVCSGTNDLTCNLGTLANGASATMTIPVTATGAGGISNIAKVTGQVSDPDSTNNLALAFVNVSGGPGASPASADLSITKTATPTEPAIGDTVTSTITVVNQGPDSASGVVVTDVLFGVFGNLSASSTQGSCTVSGLVTCNLGTMASGATVTLTVTFTAGNLGPFSDLATVISQTSDPDLGNNNAAVNLSANGKLGGGGCRLNRSDNPLDRPITILLALAGFAGYGLIRMRNRSKVS